MNSPLLLALGLQLLSIALLLVLRFAAPLWTARALAELVPPVEPGDAKTFVLPATEVADALALAGRYARLFGRPARRRIDEVATYAAEHPGEIAFEIVMPEIPPTDTRAERLRTIGRSLAFAAFRGGIVSFS